MEHPAFLLTNSQRECLGLPMVEDTWEWVKLKPSPYEKEGETWACFDGDVIRRAVTVGPKIYVESCYAEQTTEDRTLLLPRTARGKAKKLSAVTLGERKPYGMSLAYRGRYPTLLLANCDTQQVYYSDCMEHRRVRTFGDFCAWLDRWRLETTPADQADIAAFAAAKRQHVKFREGDFFRFKVGRRHYGYGRILLDYERMRKAKEPFWDILMGKPLVVKVYHLITEDAKVTPGELKKLPALPSQFMMDNDLFYGNYPIIGSLPLENQELDCPIMYGGSISMRDAGKGRVLFQCGRIFREKVGTEVLHGNFRNNGIGTGLRIRRCLWEDCIAAGSNAPLWAQSQDIYHLRTDLRNPAYRRELQEVCRQFDLRADQLPILLEP